jgi:large subunit ribosomal protein L21
MYHFFLYFCSLKINHHLKTNQMYAIVDIAGQQFKIEKDKKIYVHRLKAEEGAQITIDKVMLLDNNGKVKVGSPLVKGVEVTATVLHHLKGDKVLVFKKKRRKGYQTLNGHRQHLTSLQINDIVVK